MMLYFLKEAQELEQEFVNFKNKFKDVILERLCDYKNKNYWLIEEKEDSLYIGVTNDITKDLVNYYDNRYAIWNNLINAIIMRYQFSSFAYYKDVSLYDWINEGLTAFVKGLFNRLKRSVINLLKLDDEMDEIAKGTDEYQELEAKKQHILNVEMEQKFNALTLSNVFDNF